MNVDPDLLAELRASARGFGVSELRVADAWEFAMRVQEAFVADPEAKWWWTALREPMSSLHYGDEDGLTIILNLQAPDAEVVLVVTDDEQPPWPAFAGALAQVVAMIRHVRVFEFWIAPRDLQWVAFDTHENAVVVAGALAARAST